MRRFCSIALAIIPVFVFCLVSGVLSAGQQFPKINGKETLATVNGEPITLDEFSQELVSLHAAMVGEKKVGKVNESELLKRLINTRLILQEARRTGLNELPEMKEMGDVFSKGTMREQLIERQLKGIKADEKEIEKIYRESIKEWKIDSVILEKEEDGKKMEGEIKAGRPFEEAAKTFIAAGTAKGGEEKDYLGRKDLLPQISDTLSKMKIGSVSPIIRVSNGFVILKLQDIRYPENPEAKKQARQEALNHARERATAYYKDALIKKYVKIHKDILDRLDYESKEPGFQKLLGDKRTVAEIAGEKPITVGELTESIQQQFFHGIERAIEEKRVNEKKLSVFQDMLQKRILRKEALRLGIDKTAKFKNSVKEYENSVLFGAFIQKAVAPDVKLKEEEVKNYYNQHIGEYTYPEMMKISSLVFKKRNDAEDAMDKLRKGTELQWLKTNAEGQVDKDAKDLLSFEGKFLTTKDLPEGLRKAIVGAKPGNLRLYANPEGYFYVLSIQDVAPAKPQPYEEAKETIAKLLYNEELNKAVEDWADKLRAASNVKIYLKNN